MDRIYWVFESEKSEHQGQCRWSDLKREKVFKEVGELVDLMEKLDGKMSKVLAYLKSPVGQRVRTNNQVEGANRKMRMSEKNKYKWRNRVWVVRFVILGLDHWWEQVFDEEEDEAGEHGRKTKARQRARAKPKPETGSGFALAA